LADPDIKELITEKSAAAEQGDFLALLGVQADASKPEIQKAYFDLAKQLHPDRVARFDPEGDLKTGGAQVFKALSDAYNTLMDPRRKATYLKEKPPTDAQLGTENDVRSTQELLGKKPDDPSVTAREAAKIFYHRGMMAMKKGDFGGATEFITRALESDPESARYALQLGWAIFQNTDESEKERYAQARQYLEQAVGSDAENPEAHYYMARYYKAVGDNAECKKHLEVALSHRENYIEAKRELRLLNMRAEKSGPKSSGKSSTRLSKGGKGTGKAAPAESRWPFGLDRFFKKK
jgi:curved DNA-binding protein CbpA